MYMQIIILVISNVSMVVFNSKDWQGKLHMASKNIPKDILLLIIAPKLLSYVYIHTSIGTLSEPKLHI